MKIGLYELIEPHCMNHRMNYLSSVIGATSGLWIGFVLTASPVSRRHPTSTSPDWYTRQKQRY